MVCSGETTLGLYGIAVFAVLRRSHLRRKQKQKQIPSKDIISEQIHTKYMISDLPDDILMSIMMRMRTKDSIRTSILSKRWRNLYKFMPDIEFRCCDLLVDCCCSSSYGSQHGSNLILQIVDSFFRLRSGSDKIRSLSFCCCSLTKSHADHLEGWIRSLGKLGVEELVLDFQCRNDLSFSYSLVSEMPSLKSLKLTVCSLQPPMGKTQLCESLQILILGSVDVLPGALECILSNCLSLHRLSLDSCNFEPTSKLSFSCPNLQLKSLYILDCSGIRNIRLGASNLMTFEFKNPYLDSIIFDHVPRLQSVYLDVVDYNILPYVFGTLVQDLPQLKSLAFHTTPDLLKLYNSPVGMINMFSNLRQLDFGLNWTMDMNLLLLIPFLQSCPLLQEFHLDMSDLRYTGARLEKQAILFHSELKKVELSGFHGTENELEFALYMLKSAVGLELMHISRCLKVYNGYGSWLRTHDYESKWSRWTHRMIHRKLSGQSVSKTARLVIQYESLPGEDKWGRSGGC